MRIASILLAAAVAISTIAVSPTAAVAGFWHKDVEASECSDPAILKKVARRFHHQSHEVHHDRLRIEDFAKVHQHRYYPPIKTRSIARRYCGATAVLSDGRRRTLWYFIETEAGFAGIGDNVEFCVSGFDRWNVYNAHCRIAR
ncbi:MAG: hypothetical protein WCC66_03080 [Rhizobiaceae bacterium]